MKRFSVVDHFVISEQLYCESVTEVCVYHEVDNTSDHEPIGLKLHVDAQQYSTQPRSLWAPAQRKRATMLYFEGYRSFTKFRLRILVILLFYFITASVRSC